MPEEQELPEGFIPAEMLDPAEQIIGPFYKHKDEPLTLFWPEQQHTNLSGMVHGGVLMTFADFTLCSTAMRGSDDTGCITINLNCSFVGNTEPGGWIEGTASMTRRTGSMAFVTGEISANGEVIMTFNGVGKRERAK